MRTRKQRILTIALAAVAMAFLVTAIETVVNSLKQPPQVPDATITTRVNQQSMATNQNQSPITLPDNLPFGSQQSPPAKNQLHTNPVLKSLIGDNKIAMQRVEASDPITGRSLSHVVQYLTSEERGSHLKHLMAVLQKHAYEAPDTLNPDELKLDQTSKFSFVSRQQPSKRVTIHFIPEKAGPATSSTSRTRVLLWYKDQF